MCHDTPYALTLIIIRDHIRSITIIYEHMRTVKSCR
nr:MAG TPA: hypothetical protein [Caudoviricetes sp.]